MSLQIPTRERLRALAKERPSPAMIQEVIRAVITRVMRDKILMGLVILGILAVFVVPNLGDGDKPEGPTGGTVPGSPPPGAMQSSGHDSATPPPQAGAGQTAPGQAAAPQTPAADPALATEFAKFWMNGAMNYNAQSADASHKEAFKWMTPEAQAYFETHFWSPDIANGINSGQLRAAFQPISVVAQAVNPDGSVVVVMTGTLLTQQDTVRPVTHQIVMDLLVRKESENYRIAGLYNRSSVMAQ